MSAFIITPEEIAVIAAANNSNTYYDEATRQQSAIKDAETLIMENINSVSYRYKDCPSDPEKAIPKWFTDLTYEGYMQEVKSFILTNILLQDRKGIRTDVIKDAESAWRTVNSYIYQSSEHPEWEGSPGNFIALNAGHNVARKLLDEDRFGRIA